MARQPHKIVRFLVWSSASREYKEDALIAFDEAFEQVYFSFGPIYAHWWSVSQAIRSLPYGMIITLAKVGTTIAALVS
nr:hypothetical protein KS05_32325 [Rhizobium brockwellii]